VKVLDVTEFYSERGGGVRSHLTLKSHVLCQLGHEHVVVAPGARDSDDEVLKNETDGVGRLARAGGSARVIRIGGPASPYDPTYHLLTRFDKICGIVKRERPDVLEVHSPYLAAWGTMRADRAHYGIRTFQWHSDFIDTYAGVLRGQLHLGGLDAEPTVRHRAVARMLGAATDPLWGLVRGISERCDATLVAAAWQREKLTAHGVPRVVRVPFGIERSIFHPDARSAEARREMIGLTAHSSALGSDVTIVVGVGRFAVEKRWDIVIDAFLKLRARPGAPPTVLVLIGDGPERARMEARSACCPDIAMPGFVRGRAELARMLASADMLLHGCPFETFGLSIAEAMSCGLPAVVPDAGGASEMHVPGAGETYRALDVAACTDAAARLLTRLAREPGKARTAAAEAAKRLPNVTEQFEGQVALYERLLNFRGRTTSNGAREHSAT
jgi:alpha-1,6-mannosyltransferase